MLLAPLAANGAAATPRIGLLAWWPCDISAYVSGSGEFSAFMRGLVELGYQPGETVVVECRSAERNDDGLAAAAAELVLLPVDVIVSSSQAAGHAAQNATDAIPIVTIVSGDPVAAGLADSLAKPGGNLTGVSYYATELSAKRMELLKAAVPDLASVGVLANPGVSYLPFEKDAKRAASQLGIKAKVYLAGEPDGLADAFGRMVADGMQGAFILPDLMLADQSDAIAALALEHRLPAMAWGPWFARAGCLMAYTADYSAMSHRLASHVDRILKGAAPGDLPIEQPATFSLLINLATAETLGIEVPDHVLALADELIE